MAQGILIISDEPNEFLRRTLEARGFNVTVTEPTGDGYQRIVEPQIELVVIDLKKAIVGTDLVKRIRSAPDLNRVKILTITEWGTGQASLALSQGVDGLELKPIDSARLIGTVEKLLREDMVMTARATTANQDTDEPQ